MTRRLLRLTPAVLIAVSIFAVPLGYLRVRERHLRNFRVVEDGVLYRSAQLSPRGLERVIHDHGIRTVVSFRYGEPEGADPPDKWEEKFCADRGINYVRIRPRFWEPDEQGVAPADEGVAQFLDVLSDPARRPVLVHCFRGVHRTGSYCAVYRMECNGWTNAEALEELKQLGYDNLDREPDVRGYLERYVPKRK